MYRETGVLKSLRANREKICCLQNLIFLNQHSNPSQCDTLSISFCFGRTTLSRLDSASNDYFIVRNINLWTKDCANIFNLGMLGYFCWSSLGGWSLGCKVPLHYGVSHLAMKSKILLLN